MSEPVMKVTDHESGEVYWLAGHDHDEAYEGFGQDIDIVDMIAAPVQEEIESDLSPADLQSLARWG